jgi:hypothetical protein
MIKGKILIYPTFYVTLPSIQDASFLKKNFACVPEMSKEVLDLVESTTEISTKYAVSENYGDFVEGIEKEYGNFYFHEIQLKSCSSRIKQMVCTSKCVFHVETHY